MTGDDVIGAPQTVIMPRAFSATTPSPSPLTDVTLDVSTGTTDCRSVGDGPTPVTPAPQQATVPFDRCAMVW
ncbi:MAG: hypothetical protein U0636_11175 [Phycisphaerales bacterium]